MIRIKWALIAVLVLMFSAANAQTNWELRRDENGIKIYSRKQAGSKLVELRLITQLNTSEGQLINAMLDVDNYHNWIYGNKRSTLVKKINDRDLIYYTETKLPWPVQDRDLVTELTITPATATSPLTMTAKSVSGILGSKTDYIRVPYSSATWRIVPVADNRMEIDYTFSVDPGGSVPGWLVNMTIAKGPYESFMKLTEMLKQPKPNDSILAAR